MTTHSASSRRSVGGQVRWTRWTLGVVVLVATVVVGSVGLFPAAHRAGASGPADPTGDFTSLTPARILDTRDGTGHVGPLGGGGSFDVQVTGEGQVPASGVSAVVLNATVTNTTGFSYLTVWPTGASQPLISNLNYVPGQTVPNLVTVQVGSGGKVSVYNNAGMTDVIFDVVGYYADGTGTLGSRLHSITPFRFFDTRNGGTLGWGATLGFNVTGVGGVPSTGVTAVVMNVTVTDPTFPSFLTVYPSDVPRPLASNLNYTPGLTVPNLVTVRVPSNGVVDFYNNAGDADVIADVMGYYTAPDSTEAGRFVPMAPLRFADTRGTGLTLGPGDVLGVQIAGNGGVPTVVNGTDSAVTNITVTDTTAAGFLTAFSDDLCPSHLPFASNLNFTPGQTVPNLAIVGMSTGSAGCAGATGFSDFFNDAGSTDVIVDVFGYFTNSGATGLSTAQHPSPPNGNTRKFHPRPT